MADYGTSNDQKFTTYTRQNDHYTDEVDYAMMRYYFYSHAAFVSPDQLPGDPADPQSWNKYAYVGNDPINFIDPDGLCRINGVAYPDGQPPCPGGTSVTVTTPGPGGSSIGSIPPGACLPIYWDDVYMGNTCGGLGRGGFTDNPDVGGTRVTPPPPERLTIGPDRSQSNLPACAAVGLNAIARSFSFQTKIGLEGKKFAELATLPCKKAR